MGANGEIRTDIPHSARIWNYWMGGKDNYDIDCTVGDDCARIYPRIGEIACEARRFAIRTVRYLAEEAGVGQFLDLGVGLPTPSNVHDVAQQIAPAARVVYVDNDPLVLTHARAMLTSRTCEGVTCVVDADFRDTADVIGQARQVLTFSAPIAVLMVQVLGHTASTEEMWETVAATMSAVPSGSYLAVYDVTDTDDRLMHMFEAYARSGAAPYRPRTQEALQDCMRGLETVAARVPTAGDGQPATPRSEAVTALPVYRSVGRKP
ncbi:SAM-dependent methyltransferase [Nocardia mexicana]|uniref:S-adenosyl methyltransferase n=2 Tax=Nocardia mexicana TaxID=279262 RepID=A0A370GJW5_9NOCA|nr:SAM-dependent methyltransferase [Nocardia mexicana]RDI43549.1 S-adenosyl methyltransferase [Nocardia mexicana]